MKKRTIHNNIQIFKNIKNIAPLNKVNTVKINNCSKNHMNSLCNFPPFNHVARRQFSTFSNFPPPQDPNHLMFMIVALTVSYIIVKKL